MRGQKVTTRPERVRVVFIHGAECRWRGKWLHRAPRAHVPVLIGGRVGGQLCGLFPGRLFGACFGNIRVYCALLSHGFINLPERTSWVTRTRRNLGVARQSYVEDWFAMECRDHIQTSNCWRNATFGALLVTNVFFYYL